jgi:aryl-alcohol dehydrogenase-like predicted oxidoreductase
MNYRDFGHFRTSVSEVGLGCWQIGGAEWGDVDEEQGTSVLNAAYDAGTTFFATADVYGLGRSESLIGKFHQNVSDNRIFVSTKLGRFPDPGWPGNFTRSAVRKHVEASLERLDVLSLDLEQLHCVPTEVLRQGEIFEWLRELKTEGKIAHFGASVESDEEALICLEQEGLESLQIIFNIFRQKPITEIFDKAVAKRVSIIARLPLASGVLSGKFTRDTKFAATDHRTYNRDGAAFNVGETFAGLPFEYAVDLAQQLQGFVPANLTMAAMALRWCLDHEAVTVVIPGAKNAEYAWCNATASDLAPLGEELHTALHEFYDAHVKEHIRGPY